MFELLDHLGERVHVFLDNHAPHRWFINTHEGNLIEGERLNGLARIKGGGKSPDFERTLFVGLVDCEFVVDQDKRLKCQQTKSKTTTGTGRGKKDIHAWVVGTLVKYEAVADDCTTEVTYHFQKYPGYYIKVKKREGKTITDVDSEHPILRSKKASFGFEKESGWLPLKVYRPE